MLIVTIPMFKAFLRILQVCTSYVLDTPTFDRQGTSKLGFKQRKVEHQTLITPGPTKRTRAGQRNIQTPPSGIQELIRRKYSYCGDHASIVTIKV